MPTVLRESGFQVIILTHDYIPMHVHVKHGGESITIDLENLGLRQVYLSDRNIHKALRLVEDNRDFLIAEWRRIDPIP
jgi:hypothetical protein